MQHHGIGTDPIGQAALAASRAGAELCSLMSAKYDVLILEDDPLLRMLFAHALSGEGFIVREAGSAAEAWAVLREPAGVRVLLADQDLGASPGEPDGFVVTAEALQLHQALVVIYASAAANAFRDCSLTARERALPKLFMLKALVALAREVIV